MAKQADNNQIKEITAQIEKGIQELFESEKYRQYLNTMSRFHSYSFRNTMLIHLQRPDATMVAGYNHWEKSFGRYVKKGEKGIKIFAPAPYMKKIQTEKIDPDTHLPMIDADGKPVTEEKSVKMPRFKVVSVFDVSQTFGKPIPQLASQLTGNVENYDVFMEALRRSSPLPINLVPLDDADGYCYPDHIDIREGMSEVQTVCAAIHEMGHGKLHRTESTLEPIDDANASKDRLTKEVEAESISYVVCQYFGIETGENSFGYIAEWSSGKELKELKASLETINQTASELIGSINKHYLEICQEKGIDPVSLMDKNQEDKPLSFEDLASLANEIDQVFLSVDTFSYMQDRPDREKACEDILLDIAEFGIDSIISDIEELEENTDKKDLPKVRALLKTLHSVEDKELPPIHRPDGELETMWLLGNGDYLHIQATETGFDYTVYDETLLIVNEEGSLERALLSMTDATTKICKNLDFPSATERQISLDTARFIQDAQPLLEAEGYDIGLEAQQFSTRFAVYVTSRMEDIPIADLPFSQINEIRDWVMENLRKGNFRPLSDVLLDIIAAKGQDGAFSYLADDLAKMNMDSFRLTQALSGNVARTTNEFSEPSPAGRGSTNSTYDNTVPDPLVSQDFMREYGYKDMDILPMTQDRAKELFPYDVSLYMLYFTGTEDMVLSEWDVEHHDALFGISQDDWDSIKDKVPHRDVEKRFLNCSHDAFAIYQLRPEAPADLAGVSFGSLTQPPNRENYQAIYLHGLNSDNYVLDNLNYIADAVITGRFEDFTGNKHNTGDIIALKQNGIVSYHYCDYGDHDCFKELYNFQKPENHLRAAEMSTEDDYGMIDGIINNGKQPTVAELEQQAKSGTPISLMDLADAIQREKKQSVLEQLKTTTRKPPSTGKAKKKSEREI